MHNENRFLDTFEVTTHDLKFHLQLSSGDLQRSFSKLQKKLGKFQ